ncbi:MAG: hypothetical protein JNM78_03660 [Cyclobacteriaceae bacterium]|nr:hypothetical protein [Cyclobacteriaceae bacterium]
MRRIILIIFLSSLQVLVFAQKNTIEKAMQDELDRSMKDLRLDTLEKPFYISCTIQDVKVYSITAVLGGIVNSSENSSRGKGNRVLIGGYEFNDESFDNNLFSTPEANDIDVPLDDDYLGIRRAIWVSIDNVYKSASRQFAKNQEMLKDQKKPLEELPHRRFEKVAPFQITTDYTPVAFDEKKWEQILRQLTDRFKTTDYPGSTLQLNFVQGFEYFVSSEGTHIKSPIHQAVLQLSIFGKDSDGGIVYDQSMWCGFSPDDFPSVAELQSAIKAKIAHLDQVQKMKKFDDEYSGPVLFEGAPVADILSGILFMSRDGLLYDNNIQGLTGMRPDTRNSMESKIGKNVVSPSISVKALSKKQHYKETKLLGAFQADSEGTPPPDELVLVEKGILKDMLNDRTLTSSTQKANGHRDGPGVIQVSMSESIPTKDMKEKLISQAKEAGLEFGLMIKNESIGRIGMFNVYKVNVADGSEELLRNARFSSLSMKNLRKVLGSSEEAIYNTPSLGNNSKFTSYIVPKSLLMTDVDIMSADLPSFNEKEFVKDPLRKD